MGYTRCDICNNLYDNRGFKKHYTKCLANINETPLVKIVETPLVNIDELPLLNIVESPLVNIDESPLLNIDETPLVNIDEVNIQNNTQLINNEMQLGLDNVRNATQLINYLKQAPLNTPFYYWFIQNRVGGYQLSQFMYNKAIFDNGQLVYVKGVYGMELASIINEIVMNIQID